MPKQKHLFVPGGAYLLSNIGNSGEEIFLGEENYDYFLQGLSFVSEGLFDVLGYCLIPNQFHVYIKVRSRERVLKQYARYKRIPEQRVELISGEISLFISRMLANFLNGYAKAFNNRHGRKGSLFREHFRKIPLPGRTDGFRVMLGLSYIPVIQDLVQDPMDWKYYRWPDEEKRGKGLSIDFEDCILERWAGEMGLKQEELSFPDLLLY
ncbi:MAG: hypothetical protein JNL88_13450 [Bacteroidia bacterium]|nr:hypothetical protein [Bacteroidia bacterium]